MIFLGESALFAQENFLDVDAHNTDTTDIYIWKNPYYEWISYQMKITLQTEEEKLGFQCFFVNRADSLMYFNLHKSGIELARVVLTPDSVIYVNKLENEFYRGNYRFLEKMFGFKLDFPMIQDILNGRDFTSFENNMVYTQDTCVVLISPLRRNLDGTKSIMQELRLTSLGTISRNDITDLQTMRNVKLSYDGWNVNNYQFNNSWIQNLIDTLCFFTSMKLAIESEGVDMDITVKNVKIDQPGPTAIRIPDSFSEISISQ